MLFLFKLCLGIVSVAGLSSAVAVPVTMNSGKSILSTATKEDLPIQQVTVSMCNNTIPTRNQGAAVNFGSSGLNEICGDSESSNQVSSNKDEVSQVLQKVGGSASFSKLGLAGMTDYCVSQESGTSEEEDENKGVLTLGKGDGALCKGIEYLRLGNNSNAFLKKSKGDNSSALKFGMCVNNCGEGQGFSSSDSTTQTSVTEKKASWNELRFYEGMKN